MSKRKTVGKRTDTALKRAIERAWDEPAAIPSATIANIYVAMLVFVRRAQAKAWDECCDEMSLSQTDKELTRYSNPYRGRARR